MDKLKNQVLTEKSIRLLRQEQYTFDVYPKLTKSETKKWVEQFFDVKVSGINSCRVPHKKKRKKSNQTGFLVYARRKKMIIKLDNNFKIPLFLD